MVGVRHIIYFTFPFILFACGDSNSKKNDKASDEGPAFTRDYSCGSHGASVTEDSSPNSYTLFESGAVRPVAVSEDEQRAYVVNTPANCLEIYTITDQGLQFESAVMVGMEPVSVAVNHENEVWVANHLSDSISIVDVSSRPYVKQTLLVGDEPRDIVFAGNDRRKAFVSAAYRGQNHPEFNADDLTTSGLGRADVWVFDANHPGDGLNGQPIDILNLFTDSIRGLAVSGDGNTVYAASFMSGNQTTVVDFRRVLGDKPEPHFADGEREPFTGLIVKHNGLEWVDQRGKDWSDNVHFDLPDYDLFVINANENIPSVVNQVSGLGTSLFNVAVNPVSNEVYVSNQEAFNHIRFEGPGHDADNISESTVRGHIAESRISVVNGDNVTINHLNPHIDFDLAIRQPTPEQDKQKSLAQPLDLTVSPDGRFLYVTAFGSSKVAKISTEALRSGEYKPDESFQIDVPGGPAGLALLNGGKRLLVYTRFDNGLHLYNAESGALIATKALFSPESESIIKGRPFLYDADLTSGNGTSACGSCHLFGDMDGLAWDLGDPDGKMTLNTNLYVSRSEKETDAFHPLKGPMTTQTFRGMKDSGPLHWRGDRTGVNREVVNGELESIEAASFKEFNAAFVGLVGRTEPLSSSNMQDFTDFSLAIIPPPNPIRNLDNSLTPQQQNGRDIYFNFAEITGTGSCNHCHAVNPDRNHFGTNGFMSFEGGRVHEDFKIPHLRNAYQKVGMFGSSDPVTGGQNMGPQVRGFGFLHDGSADTLNNFFQSEVFEFPAPVEQSRADVERYVLAIESNMAPVVGQQVTLTSTAQREMIERVNLLEERAKLNECDLIVSGVIDNQYYSALFQTGDDYYQDAGNGITNKMDVRGIAMKRDNALTYTCVPIGAGRRLALNQ